MLIKVNLVINQFIFSKNERNENYFDSSCRSVPVTQVQILVLDSRIRCVLSFSLEVSVVKNERLLHGEEKIFVDCGHLLRFDCSSVHIDLFSKWWPAEFKTRF